MHGAGPGPEIFGCKILSAADGFNVLVYHSRVDAFVFPKFIYVLKQFLTRDITAFFDNGCQFFTFNADVMGNALFTFKLEPYAGAVDVYMLIF
jgi:hypothetical protein